MSCPLQRARWRAFTRLLGPCASSPMPAWPTPRLQRCLARQLSSSATSVTDNPPKPAAGQSAAATPPPRTSRKHRKPADPNKTSTNRPSSSSPSSASPPPPRALTPAILRQFHGATPSTARSLITSLLSTHSTTLTPADYGTLMQLAHSLTPHPHTLILTLYRHYTARHHLSLAPDSLYQYTLPVLHSHDRTADVLVLYKWLARRRLMDQVMLGVLLRACEAQQDGELAWRLWDKYRAVQPPPEERRLGGGDDERESSVEGRAGGGKSGGSGGGRGSKVDRRSEGAALGRFVEESLFPHSSYHNKPRGAVSSPTSAFNLLHYTYIVSALRHHAHHANQAINVLRHMQRHGVRPDALFYNRLLSTLTTKSLPACCLSVLRDMERSGVPIDGRVYYFVITSHAARGRWSEVVRLIAEMRSRGLSINEHVYEAAVVCCSEAGHVQRAKDIAAEMQHRAVPMTWRCYSALVTLAGRMHDWQWVRELFEAHKERPEFHKQLVANDRVFEAFKRAERLPDTSRPQLTAEQVYRQYFPETIGPRGLWMLMQPLVEAEREAGLLQCGTDLRELLQTATTPRTVHQIGRMQVSVRSRWRGAGGGGDSGSRSHRAIQSSKKYQLFVPNTPIDEAVASLDILLLCMLYRSVIRQPKEGVAAGGGGTSGADEAEEASWREHLLWMPDGVDHIEVVTPQECLPPRETTLRNQLHRDPIYAGSDSRATDSQSKREEEDEQMAGSAEEAEDEADLKRTENEEEEEEEELARGEEKDDGMQLELSDPTSSQQPVSASVDSDPTHGEAVREAEAELRATVEEEAPSIGRFVAMSLNSLWSFVTAPLQRRTGGHTHSVLEVEAEPEPNNKQLPDTANNDTDNADTAPPDPRSASIHSASTSSASTSSSSTSAGSSVSDIRPRPPSTSSLLSAQSDPSLPSVDPRVKRASTLMHGLQTHLKMTYGICALVRVKKTLHCLTITPSQLQDWLDREVRYRRAKAAQHTTLQRSHNQRTSGSNSSSSSNTSTEATHNSTDEVDVAKRSSRASC